MQALTLVALAYDSHHLPAALPREGDSQNHDVSDRLFLGLNLGRHAHCIGVVTTLFFCLSVKSYFCDHRPGLQWSIPQLHHQLSEPCIYVLAALVHLKLFVHQLHSDQISLFRRDSKFLKSAQVVCYLWPSVSSHCWPHSGWWETSTPTGSSICLWPPSPRPQVESHHLCANFKHKISRTP